MIIRIRTILLITASAVLNSMAVAQNSFNDQPYQQPNSQQPGNSPQPNGNWGGQLPQQPSYPPQPNGNWGGQQPQQPSYPPQPNGNLSGQQPQQPGYPPQPSGNGGGQPPQQLGGGADLDQLAQMERQDYGVQPTKQLHNGQMHGPTPASIPGGQVVTTKGLVALVQGKQAPYLLFDVLGGPDTLPGALAAVPASQPGTFNDPSQQQLGGFLQQVTQGRKDVPLIFYCQSTQCWMSYNAALRAINMGYTNVLWYRGGIEAWKSAGLPTTPSGQGFNPQQPQSPRPQQPSGYPQQTGGWNSQQQPY